MFQMGVVLNRYDFTLPRQTFAKPNLAKKKYVKTKLEWKEIKIRIKKLRVKSNLKIVEYFPRVFRRVTFAVGFAAPLEWAV